MRKRWRTNSFSICYANSGSGRPAQGRRVSERAGPCQPGALVLLLLRGHPVVPQILPAALSLPPKIPESGLLLQSLPSSLPFPKSGSTLPLCLSGAMMALCATASRRHACLCMAIQPHLLYTTAIPDCFLPCSWQVCSCITSRSSQSCWKAAATHPRTTHTDMCTPPHTFFLLTLNLPSRVSSALPQAILLSV